MLGREYLRSRALTYGYLNRRGAEYAEIIFCVRVGAALAANL